MKSQDFKVIAVSICMMFLAFTFSGCKVEGKNPDDSAKKNKELKVGYIDSDKLLAECPEFRKFQEKKQKETIDVRNKLTLGKLTEAEKQHIKDLTIEYMGKEEKILKVFVDQVREASGKIMEEKKLDLVLNNAQSNSVLEYGGEDITSDVQSRLVELRKTQSPSGDKKE
jgi:Skp family chaperone for outer membrane proteins